jgi:hypothetical protein
MDARGWVLLTDGTNGHNRSTLAAVRALAKAGYRSAVTVSGRRSVASVSRFCDRIVLTPSADDPDYASAIRAEAAARPYLTVLPASDAALQALDAPGRSFCHKAHLAVAAREAGLETPPGRIFHDAGSLRAAAGALDYPLVVKPVIRTGSSHGPARRFDTAEHLRRAPDMPGPLLVQPVVSGGMHAVVGVMWRGELKAVVHQQHLRIWPPQCGDACCAITTPPLPALEKGLQTMLTDYNGIFQAEFAGPSLVDLNPRVYGSLPLAVSAGANLVGVYCDLVRGVDVTPLRGRVGVEYHWWGGDARHLGSRWWSRELTFAESVRALGLRQALSRENVALSDPKPVLERSRHMSLTLAARLLGVANPLALAGRALNRPRHGRPAEE